jgi:hypothetical protein
MKPLAWLQPVWHATFDPTPRWQWVRARPFNNEDVLLRLWRHHAP